MKAHSWNIRLLVVALCLFNLECTRATCPTPDVFEYKFYDVNCLENVRRFPSTIAKAGDMTMPSEGVGVCASGGKEINGVWQTYLNGMVGVSPTGTIGDVGMGLVTSKTIGESGINATFADQFTMEFVVRPQFDYSKFTEATSFALVGIGYEDVHSPSCDLYHTDFSLHARAHPDGKVSFWGYTRDAGYSSCITYDIEVSPPAGQSSVLEKGVIHHISISVSLTGSGDEKSTVFEVRVTKLGANIEPAFNTATYNEAASTVEWIPNFRLYLGTHKLVSPPYHGSTRPWGGDIFYFAAYSSRVDLSCRVNSFDNIVNPSNQLPVAGDVTFTTDEDTPLEGSISDFGFDYEGDKFNIVFTQLPPANQGVLKVGKAPVQLNTNVLSTKAYTFEPAANFNGNVTFKVKASTTDGKALIAASRTATIQVASVNDKPVIVAPSEPFVVRPRMHVQIRIQVTDVEGIDGNLFKAVTRGDPHLGSIYAGECDESYHHPFGFASGNLNAQGQGLFCYVPNPDIEVVSDNFILFEDSIEVNVDDAIDPDIKGTQTFSVSVVNPLQGCGQSLSTDLDCVGKSKHEMAENPFDTVIQLYASDTSTNREFDFHITKFPLHGKLYFDNNNSKGAEITALGTIIPGQIGVPVRRRILLRYVEFNNVHVNLRYEPNKNYFNSRITADGRSSKDLLGVDIGSCDDRAKFDGFCPDTIGFRVKTKGDPQHLSPESLFPIYVANVMDKYTVYDEPHMGDVTIRPKLVDGNMMDDTATFNVIVDNFIDTVDGDIFPYSIYVEQSEAHGNLIYVNNLPGGLEVVVGKDCLENGCSEDISVIGPPSALNTFMKTLRVGLPENVDKVDIKFVVRQGSNLASDPVYEETVTVYKKAVAVYNSADVPYGIIFGTGAGVFALVGGGFVIAKKYRGKRTRDSEHLENFTVGQAWDTENGG